MATPSRSSIAAVRPVMARVPGGGMIGYLRVRPGPDGARVEVHQLVDTPVQAEFMQGAWAMVLGRLKAGLASACDSAIPMPPRPARPKGYG